MNPETERLEDEVLEGLENTLDSIKKHPGGRPKKTLDDLPKNWKEIIISEMEQGASLAEIKWKLRIHEQLFYRFMDEEPEFSKTIQLGQQAAKAWWYKNGRTQLWNGKFSPQLWYMNMKNRWGWVDKQEQTIKIDVPTVLVIQDKGKTIELKPPNKALPEGIDE